MAAVQEPAAQGSGEEGPEPRPPECEQASARPPPITGVADVLAIGAVSLGGSVGVVLSPLLLAAHLVNKGRQRRASVAAKAAPPPAAPAAAAAAPDAQAAPDGHRASDGHQAGDAHWGSPTVRRLPGAKPSLPPGCSRHVGYVRMSDGISIAIDILLPPGVSNDGSGSRPPVPCVLHCARYWRAWELRWPGRSFVNHGQPWDFGLGEVKSELLLAGFAVVSADVRGAGASEGTMSFVWSDREAQDAVELVDFIAGRPGKEPGARGAGGQPWSDGRVALFGISYDAGTAVRAAAKGHPAIKAVVCSCLFGDIYRELFPGGIMNRWFLQAWCSVNYRLDNARLQGLHPLVPVFVKGAAPAGSRRRHNQAVAAHAQNWDLMSHANKLKFMDDEVVLECGVKADIRMLDLWSKHVTEFRTCEDEASSIMGSLAAKELPVLLISAWSCVTVGTACSAFAAHAGPGWRLLLGPWNHGCVQHVRYQHDSRMKHFPLAAEIAGFLLEHLPAPAGEQPDAKPPPAPDPKPEPVRYFIDGDRPAWHSSPCWPPQQLRKHPLWLRPAGALAWDPPAAGDSESATPLPQPAGAGARPIWGGTSRYNGMIKMTDLVNLRWQLPLEAFYGRVLHFATEPLEAPAVLLGSPVLSLRLRGAGGAGAAADADVFAYLCELPGGRWPPAYVTEGQLRLSSRAERERPRHVAAADPPVADSAAAAAAGGAGAAAVPFHGLCRGDGAPLPSGGDEAFGARLALLPTGHRFSRGSRIALLLAADDPAHFDASPGAVGQPPLLCHGRLAASVLWLPLLPES